MGIRRLLRQWSEKADGTLEGPAISTEDLVNAPCLVAQKHRYISEMAGSLDLYSTTTNGSGSAVGLGDYLNIKVASGTADSFARAANVRGRVATTFNNAAVFRVSYMNRTVGGAAGDQAYLAIAGVNLNEDTYTSDHLAVGLKAGDMIASSADGATQNTTVLNAGESDATQRTVWIVWNPTDGQAEWYVDTPPQSAVSPDATHNSNLPDTTTLLNTVQFTAENDGNANEISTHVSEYALGVE